MKAFHLFTLLYLVVAVGVSTDSRKYDVFWNAVDIGDLTTVKDLLTDDPNSISVRDKRSNIYYCCCGMQYIGAMLTL